MECTLAALIACFSWSGLYLDGGISALDARVPQLEIRPYSITNTITGVVETGERIHWTDRSDNPYGRVAIGFQVQTRKVAVSLEASRMSSFANSYERAINAVSLSARWYPFR